MTLFGWDVSTYDHGRGSLDMVRAKAEGITFVTHRATIGTVYSDTPGWTLARAWDAGIPFLGGYMVVRTPGSPGGKYSTKPNGSIEDQVGRFLDVMAAEAPWFLDFPGAFWQVDTEKWTSGIGGVVDLVAIERGHEACETLHAVTGLQVMHYAPQWAYGDSVPAGFPLWASHYVNGSGPFAQLYPGDGGPLWSIYSGRRPSILQYSSHATIAGQAPADANAFMGTEDEFRALIAREGGGGMPTATQLHSEIWWQREIVTDAAKRFQTEICRRTGRPADAFGCKGNDAHLNGGHRSQEWIKNSAYCTNRSYTVQDGLSAEQARYCSAIDFTPGSADEMIRQCNRLMTAVRSGALEEVREFYGNIDGDKVVDGFNNVANRAASSDSSHLWHWHITLDRFLMNDWPTLAKILAVVLGDTVPATPTTGKGDPEMYRVRIKEGTDAFKNSRYGNGAVYLTDGTTGEQDKDGNWLPTEATHIGPAMNSKLAFTQEVVVDTEADLVFLCTWAARFQGSTVDKDAITKAVADVVLATLRQSGVTATVDPVMLANTIREAVSGVVGPNVTALAKAGALAAFRDIGANIPPQ